MSIEISTLEFETEFELCAKIHGLEITQLADERLKGVILELMLLAERREGCWVGNDDAFGSRVVDCVKAEQDMYLAMYGEIDPVTEWHYLVGPNSEYTQRPE